MTALTPLLVDLFVLFVAAKLAGELFERLRQPPVIGELLAGMIIGPAALGLVGQPGPALVAVFHGDQQSAREAVLLVHHLLAELGVIVLLFFVGLETRVSQLLQVGWKALTTAILGVIVPFSLGYAYANAVGLPPVSGLFVAAALIATSVGITARVLRDLGVLDSLEARVILGAAVADDILAMVLLAAVAGLAGGGNIDVPGITFVVLEAVGFTVFLMFVATRVARRYALHLDQLKTDDAPFIVAMTAMLGLAALSGFIGLAAIIGAFLAGIVFAEAKEHFALEQQTKAVYQFLVPFFFVVTGTLIDPRDFLQPSVLGAAAVVIFLAVIGKLLGCGLANLKSGRRSMAIVGFGMVPRGEVGLIVASIGRNLGAIPENMFTVVVMMSVVTTLMVPPILRALYSGYRYQPQAPGLDEAGLLADT